MAWLGKLETRDTRESKIRSRIALCINNELCSVVVFVIFHLESPQVILACQKILSSRETGAWIYSLIYCNKH